MKRGLTILALAAVALGAGACERESSTTAYDAPQRATGAVSYSVSGNVTQIDKTGGSFNLKTDEATLRLPFNPATMGELADGEKITARLTLSKAPAQGSQAFDAPALQKVPDGAMPSGEDQVGQKSVTGTAKNIDHDKGTFTLQADGGAFAVYFPPRGIADVKDGDRVTLYTAYTRES